MEDFGYVNVRTVQLDLFTLKPLPKSFKDKTIEERFEEFDRLNPSVKKDLITLARFKRGKHPRRRLRINALYEILRDRYDEITPIEGDEYRLNNDYRSRYAIVILLECADLSDAFETRTLREKV